MVFFLSFTPYVCCYCLELQQCLIGRLFSLSLHCFFFVLFISFMHHYSVNILMEYGVSNAILRFYRYFTHGYCRSFGFVTLDRLCKSNNWLLTLCVCSLNDRNGVRRWCAFFSLAEFVPLRQQKINAKKEGWAQGMTLTSRQITWF